MGSHEVRFDSFEPIGKSKRRYCNDDTLPIIRVVNQQYTPKKRSEVSSASFILREQAVNHLKLTEGDHVMLYKCVKGEKESYCISYVPEDISINAFKLTKAPPHHLKFTCCDMYNKLEDGLYTLSDLFEQEVSINGQKNILLWSELILYKHG